jgi:hypothetical protein
MRIHTIARHMLHPVVPGTSSRNYGSSKRTVRRTSILASGMSILRHTSDSTVETDKTYCTVDNLVTWLPVD